MLEITLFVLTLGLISSAVVYGLGFTWIKPLYIFLPIFLLTLPGLYGAFSAPFVPSSRKKLKAMLSLADLNPHDTVYDLGCGDGRFIFAAAPHVKKAVGYDLSIPLVWLGKLKALLTRSKAQIRFGNMFRQNYADADVIFCYLLSETMNRFYREIWPTLKPGTRVLSNTFSIKNLEPVKEEGRVYLYVKGE